MVDALSVYDVEILAYFSYTSIVLDEIAEFKETGDVHKDRTNPNMRLRDLYKRVVKAAENKYHNKSLEYNKCAFLFVYQKREFFIGYYDRVYTLGLSCHIVCGNIIDFKDKIFGERHSTCITNLDIDNYYDVKVALKEDNGEL